MAKIDTSSWKEFHLYDDKLFDIDMGNKFDRVKMDTTREDVNFVGRTALNNGINATCARVAGVEPYPAGTLSLALGGSIGACFVQEKPFYTSQNVIVLKPKEYIPEAAQRFVATVIWKESDLHYDAFLNELNRHIKTDFAIKLPATSSGEPDWDYMEQYMSEVMQGSEASLEALRRADSSKHKIDATGWSEFPIPSLFETERKGKRVQVPTGAWVAKKDLTEGDIPRITVSGFGNGIVGRFGLSNSKDYRLYENFISVSFLGTVFYQPEAASLDMKVHCLKPLDHTLNTLTGCFLVSVIRNTIAKYVYGDQLSSEVLASLSLKLPATSSGEPDWDYMEQYMSEVMQGSEASLEALE